MNINPISASTINKSQYEKSKVEDNAFEKIFEQAKDSKDEEKLKDACRQFESVFMNMLMKNMRNTIHDDGIMEKSYAREMFEGMLDEKIADEASKGEGMGLAQQMYKQLAKHMK
ncbi:rod-binding protein [Marinisporobacter balticus]|uniref:Flagellar protein FlgJ n=1 Tax=Marinisporobacter balticus TaxID=2018667 RepID=A0A4R2KXR1_9FIRM|nr:rod-binding protein [Marinisporobacter balticus]TCO78814.1 flagellar protein FlgJ [Marinisporobacter balticus]